jgi:hypothetical protein
MPDCDFCHMGQVVQSWKRVAPEYEVAGACDRCAADLRNRADDRSAAGDDYYRVLGLQLRLAGEVWSQAETAFWFRSPILLRMSEESKGPEEKPSPNLRPSPL